MPKELEEIQIEVWADDGGAFLPETETETVNYDEAMKLPDDLVSFGHICQSQADGFSN